jgi:hypothetical protein
MKFPTALYLTVNWTAWNTLLFHTLHHPHRPCSRELVSNNFPLRVFMLTTTDTFSTDISLVTLQLTQCFKNIMIILVSFE